MSEADGPGNTADGTKKTAAERRLIREWVFPLAAPPATPAVDRPAATVAGGANQPAASWADLIPPALAEAGRPAGNGGGATLEFRLAPAGLGPIRIRLESTPDGLTGLLTVANAAVRQMVEARLPELRQRLEGAGIPVQSVQVVLEADGPGPPAGKAQTRGFPAPPPRPGRRNRAGRVDVTA